MAARLRRADLVVLESRTPVDLAAAQNSSRSPADSRPTLVQDWTAFLRQQRVEQVVLLLLAAERSGPAGEVAEAYRRTLPLPLSQPPPALVAQWLARA
ncbi:MAG: hypothetical protein U0802_09135 [Candidatus Binatia bacterium]